MTQHQAPELLTPLDPVFERRSRGYLRVFFALVIAGAAALAVALGALKSRDHFSQITLDGDARWYRNYAHMMTREMQDRDILFSGIGKSIKRARQADVILLGHSVLEFAIVNDLVEAFAKKHGIRIYNLSNPGIASGEYARRLIKKWKLKPKVWLINADNYPANFFDPALDDFFSTGRNSTFNVVKSNRLNAYGRVISRNIRWRLEFAIAQYGPEFLHRAPYLFQPAAPTTFRNVETGNFNVDRTNGFRGPGNAISEQTGDACSATDQELEWARTYLDRIGGTPAFILTPYDKWCRQRVEELGGVLGVETLLSPVGAAFTAFDGRHMNHEGAVAYTTVLLDAFEKSRAFRVLKGLPVDDIPRSDRDPTKAVKMCVPNNSAQPFYVSVRAAAGVSDHAIDPHASLSIDTTAGAVVCSDHAAFGRGACPNEKRARSFLCQP